MNNAKAQVQYNFYLKWKFAFVHLSDNIIKVTEAKIIIKRKKLRTNAKAESMRGCWDSKTWFQTKKKVIFNSQEKLRHCFWLKPHWRFDSVQLAIILQNWISERNVQRMNKTQDMRGNEDEWSSILQSCAAEQNGDQGDIVLYINNAIQELSRRVRTCDAWRIYEWGSREEGTQMCQTSKQKQNDPYIQVKQR